eukprot:GEMP01012001.1.p1 GENE.GEMP01012001.1~~GEMP01012001.1.p1  ORF type:complete len:256 (+),score=28.63 GEMP01012001.1:49-768(+)
MTENTTFALCCKRTFLEVACASPVEFRRCRSLPCLERDVDYDTPQPACQRGRQTSPPHVTCQAPDDEGVDVLDGNGFDFDLPRCSSTEQSSKLSFGETETTATTRRMSKPSLRPKQRKTHRHQNTFQIQVPQIFKATEAAKVCEASARQIMAAVRGSRIVITAIDVYTLEVSVSAWYRGVFILAQNLVFEFMGRLFPDPARSQFVQPLTYLVPPQQTVPYNFPQQCYVPQGQIWSVSYP